MEQPAEDAAFGPDIAREQASPAGWGQPMPGSAYPPPNQSGYAWPAAERSRFADITVYDYVRDGAAVSAFAIALILPWNFEFGLGKGSAGGLVALVLLVTLVSLASLTLPYLARIGGLGDAWNPRVIRILRLVACIPYTLLIVGFLLWDVIASFTFDFRTHFALGPGIGPAIWFAVAGTVLAAQPRTAELGPSADEDRTWTRAAKTAMGVALVLVVASSLAGLADILRIGAASDSARGAGAYVLAAALPIGMTTVAVVGVLRRFQSWGLTMAGLAVVILVSGIIISFTEYQGIEQFRSPSFAIPAWVAAGLCAQATPLARHVSAEAGYRWLDACRNALLLACIWSIGSAVASVGTVALWGIPVGGTAALSAFSILAAVLAAVGCGCLRPRMTQVDPRPSREVVMGLCVAIAFVVVARSITSALIDEFHGVMPWDYFVIGITVAVVLTLGLAPAVRALYAGRPLFGPGPVRSPITPASTGGIPFAPRVDDSRTHVIPDEMVRQPNPVPHGTAGTAQTTDHDRSAACDFRTGPAELARIAYARADLRATIAGHPAAYPGLLEWLADLNDAEVNRALSQRGER